MLNDDGSETKKCTITVIDDPQRDGPVTEFVKVEFGNFGPVTVTWATAETATPIADLMALKELTLRRCGMPYGDWENAAFDNAKKRIAELLEILLLQARRSRKARLVMLNRKRRKGVHAGAR